MVQFLSGRHLEARNLDSLRIDSLKDMPDGPVLTARIHGLKDNKKLVLVFGIKPFLEFFELSVQIKEDFFSVLFIALKGKVRQVALPLWVTGCNRSWPRSFCRMCFKQPQDEEQ
jgi:hypothetical protein